MTTVSLTRRPAFSWPALSGVVLLVLAMIVLLSFIAGRTLRPYSFHGVVLQSPERAFNFELTSHQAQPVALSDFRDKAVLLFFGYSSCPDVCPTTLATLADAKRSLGRLQDDVAVVMVTVDPEVDTLERLGEYVEFFDRDFLGLTGTTDQIREVATYYGIYFEPSEHSLDQAPTQTPADAGHGDHQPEPRLVAHTSTTLLIDRDGYARLVFPYGASPEDIASDVEYVLRR